MKSDTSIRRFLDMGLAAFFLSWCFFLAMSAGNSLGIFRYGTFSGKFVMLAGKLAPLAALYVFYVIWGEVRDIRGFCDGIIECTEPGRAVILGLVFALLHIAVCRVAGGNAAGAVFLIPDILYALLFSGLQELLWTGFFFRKLYDRMAFIQASAVTGLICFLYSVPLFGIEGSGIRPEGVAYFYLYCVGYAFLICGIYALTGSLLTCITLRVVITMSWWYYPEMLLGKDWAEFLFLLQMFILFVILYRFGKKQEIKWSIPKGK